MSDYTISVLIDGKDQLSDAAKSAGGAMGGLGKFLAGAFVFDLSDVANAFKYVTSGITDCIKAAMDAENVTAELNAVLKSTGGVSGMTADSINDLALSLSKVTRFEDDAIVAGEATLLTFTKIGKDVFPMATEAMLNMAQKFGGIDSAAMQLGKALNDPVTGIGTLRKVGVQLTDAQEEMIKQFVAVGDVASAQKIILGELEVEFGGLARAAGDTLAGKMDILKNRLGNVQEAIGGALLPIITEFLDKAIVPLLPMIEKLSEDFMALMASFQSGGAQGLMDALGITPKAQETLTQMIAILGPILQAVLQGLATLVTQVLLPALQGFWVFLTEFWWPMLTTLYNWLAVNIPAAVKILADFWNSTLLPAFQVVSDFITGIVVPALMMIWNWLAVNVPAAIKTLAGFWNDTLLPAIQAVVDFITGYVVPAFLVVIDFLAVQIAAATNALVFIWSTIFLPALQAVWNFIQMSIMPLFRALIDLYLVVLKKEVELLAGIWRGILLPALLAVWQFIQDNIIPIFKLVIEVWLAGMKQGLSDLADVWTDVLKPALEKAANFIRDVFGPAMIWVKENCIDPFLGALQFIAVAIDGIIGAIEELKRKLQSIHLPAALTGNSPSPIELAFLGVGDAVRQLASIELPRLQVEFNRAGNAASTGTSNISNYNLYVTTASPVENITGDFYMMQAQAGV